MRTLHFGLRVSDLKRSLAFYTAVGYTVVGTVEGTGFGTRTMIQPGPSSASCPRKAYCWATRRSASRATGSPISCSRFYDTTPW